MHTRKTARAALAAVLFCAALALTAWAPGVASAQDVLTMKQAVERALSDNPSMRAARHDLLGAEQGRKSARGSFLPSATVTYGYTVKDHTKPTRDVDTTDAKYFSTSLNLHQDLFTGFAVLSTYQRAELARQSAELALTRNELVVIGTVQQNFLALLKAREDVRSAEDSVARLEEQLKVTTAFYEVGLKPRLDVLQAEVDLATAQEALLQAKNSVDTQVARLNTLLDLDLHADVDYRGALEYAPCTLSLDEAVNSALAARPDLQIARKGVEIAAKDKNIVDSAFYPKLGADFDWSSMGTGPDAAGSDRTRTEYSAWSASVGVSWTFFEWGKTYYASQQADQQIKSLLETEMNTRQEALYEVKANHLAVGKAAESIKVSRKALEAARESYRMAVARYQAQVGTNTDVLDAQERLTKAEAGLTSALADYQIALSKLYVSIGRKNEALVIN
ncbi:TolC family protein [Desulfocurvus sp.]|jgi:outer membrane protein|uniref:TolC family protein n=1 Tax=Desulfocurvus sp. TaxID=2871698 RepID=UPI0025C4DA06|nr:TolC family protein [Desulfocurvus sp.]MCK9240070.1 TolC family protein [Desulfocurvus sp.]